MYRRFKVTRSCCSIFEDVKPDKRFCRHVFFEHYKDCDTNGADNQWDQNRPGVPSIGHSAPCNWNQETSCRPNEEDRSNPVHPPEFVRERANFESQHQSKRYEDDSKPNKR